MEKLKSLIIDWLAELDYNEAAIFLDDCEINQTYIDTLFPMDGDNDIDMFDLTISVPLKLHRKIDEHAREVSTIESVIRQVAEADNIYVRNIGWRAYLKNSQNDSKTNEITQLLTHEYVSKQIKLMHKSVESNPHLALGISKELIETCCKHMLNEAKVKIIKDWDITRLVKESNKVIDLMPFQVDNVELAKSSVAKILSGLSNIVHGVTELRNSYGSGHGHLPEFRALDNIYIKLAVSASSELAIFYLSMQKFNKNRKDTICE